MKFGLRLSGGDASREIDGVSPRVCDWVFGGFFVETMNRGLLRNGVLIVPGVANPGPIVRTRGAGVSWTSLFGGNAPGVDREVGESSAVIGFCRGSDERVGNGLFWSDLRSSEIRPPNSSRLRFCPSLSGAKIASNSSSKGPGVPDSPGGVLLIPSSTTPSSF